MTTCHRFVALLFLSALSAASATATLTLNSQQQHAHLRSVMQASNEEIIARQRRLEEPLQAVAPADTSNASEAGGDKEAKNEQEEIAVHASGDDVDGEDVKQQKQRESSSVDSSSSSADEGANDNKAKAENTVPSATFTGREAEDPLLAQEDSASTILLDISLSMQRFLGLAAAIAGMIFTAYSVSENPDGLYASLCRSILTGFRVLCRVVTCKACFFGDGRSRAAHRHIPVDSFDTWSVNIE